MHWLEQENIEIFDIYTDPDSLHPLLCVTVSDPDAFVLSIKYPNIAQTIRDHYQHILGSGPFWSDFIDEIDRKSEIHMDKTQRGLPVSCLGSDLESILYGHDDESQ